MKLFSFVQICLLIMLCSNLAHAQEQQYTVELRHLSTHEALIRALEIPTFATSDADDSVDGFRIFSQG